MTAFPSYLAIYPYFDEKGKTSVYFVSIFQGKIPFKWDLPMPLDFQVHKLIYIRL